MLFRSKNEIVVPEKEQFKSGEAFYGTLFHEMTHSTGAEGCLLYTSFGRFGWLGKIAGAFLGMMLIGNNAGIFRTPDTGNIQRVQDVYKRQFRCRFCLV